MTPLPFRPRPTSWSAGGVTSLALAAGCLALLGLVAPAWATQPRDSSLEVWGRAESRVDEPAPGPHVRTLALRAHRRGHDQVRGTLRFRHDSPEGVARFVGAVTCLQRDEGGRIQLSGRVRWGENRAGEDLSGKDFAFTIHTEATPQTFSLPRFGENNSLPSCAGGREETVPVSRGRFHTRDGPDSDPAARLHLSSLSA